MSTTDDFGKAKPVFTPPESVASKALEFILSEAKNLPKGSPERKALRTVYKEIKELDSEERTRLYSADDKREMCGTCAMEVTPLNPYHVAKGEIGVMVTLAEIHRQGFDRVKAAQNGESVILPDGKNNPDDPFEGGTVIATMKEFRNRCRWLTYFGLVDTAAGDGRRGSSIYCLSDKGWDFLKRRKNASGKVASVPGTIWCRQGRVFHESAGRITSTEAKGLDLQLYKDYWDGYSTLQEPFDPDIGIKVAKGKKP